VIDPSSEIFLKNNHIYSIGGSVNNMRIFIIFHIIVLVTSHLNGNVVTSTSELREAIKLTQSGKVKEILVEDGIYELGNMIWIGKDNITIRSRSGNRDAVIIRGRGMYGSTTHIFNVWGTNFTVKDMTIGWVANHAIQIHGNNNSSNTVISNLRIVDTYEQMVKVYPEAESWDKPIDSNRLFWYELFGLALSCWKLKFTM